VGVFSLEMTKEELVKRMLTSEAQLDSQRIRKGIIESSDWPKLMTAAGKFAKAKIFIDDSSITLMEIMSKSRQLHGKEGLDLIIVDYLQLVTAGNFDRKDLEIGEISRSFKMLAKELELPIIVLSQLNREVEKRPNKRPQMSDLRESGSIEQDADLIMFIYRDEVYTQTEDNRGRAEINIVKQRAVPTGTVNMTFKSECTRFMDLSHQQEPYAG